MRRALTWKVAVAGGAVIGAGFGSITLAGADSSTTPADTVELDSVQRQLTSPGAPLSVLPAAPADRIASVGASPAPDPAAESAPSTASVASAASVASPASVPSPASAPSAEAASVASPASVPSPASAPTPAPAPEAEAESAPSPASTPTPAPAPAPEADQDESPVSPSSVETTESVDS